MSTLHISPTGSGRADGSSWENAGRISQLSTLVDQAGPGGTVLLRADQGSYTVTSPIQIRYGGEAGAPVTIRGVDGFGAPMAAEIVGNRNIAAGVTGSEVFRLMNGADHLVFETMTFRDVGNGAFRIGADIRDISIRHMEAYNVQRFIEDTASGTNTSASVTGLTVQDVDVHGFSKGAIRLQYDSNNILIEDVYGDGQKQSHDDFAMGVLLDGTVHNVVIRDTTMANAYNSMTSYWNGDGFVTEAGVYTVRFENTDAFGNTDGGYDLKSRDTVLIDASASNNKRNYRVWSDSVTIQNSTGDDPDRTGGSGSEAQVWLATGAKATIINSTFTNTDNGAAVFELSQGAVLTLQGTVKYDAGAVYSKLGFGAVINQVPTLAAAVVSPAPPALVVAPAPPAAPAIDAPKILTGGAGWDTLAGGSGDDKIDGMAGDDSIAGGAGADQLYGGRGADRIDGGDGADVIVGDAFALGGSPGQNDVIDGGAGADVIYGDATSLSGDAAGGADLLRGGDGDDVIYGDAATMSKDSKGGADTVHGGAGNDKIYGDSSNDHPRGGADSLYGEAGDDMLFGGAGNDMLDGGGGSDILTGGAGADVFRFSNLDAGADHVTDFKPGTDRIGLSSESLGITNIADVHLLFDPVADAGAGPAIRYHQATGQLFWDRNGGAAGDQVLLATLDNHALISHDSLMLIA